LLKIAVGIRRTLTLVKFTFTSQPFVDLLDGSEEEVLMREEQLQRVLATCDTCLAQRLEKEKSIRQLQMILEKKMSFPGTKCQIKPSFRKSDRTFEKLQLIVKWGGEVRFMTLIL
jgi:inositol hexakisphosphate/diphosphoinositol-pentakisphosphate kinase